jgi:hypothetical protein
VRGGQTRIGEITRANDWDINFSTPSHLRWRIHVHFVPTDDRGASCIECALMTISSSAIDEGAVHRPSMIDDDER